MHKTWTDFTICLFFLPLLLAHHTLSTHHSFTAILSIWSTFFLIFCLDSNEQQHKNIKNQNQPKKKGKPFHCEDHGIEATPHITTRSTSANLSANNHESTDDYCLLKFEPSDCSYLCKDPKKKPQKTQQIKPINKQRTLSNSSTRYLSVARTHIHSHSLNIRVFVSIYSILWDIWFSVLYLIVCVCVCLCDFRLFHFCCFFGFVKRVHVFKSLSVWFNFLSLFRFSITIQTVCVVRVCFRLILVQNVVLSLSCCVRFCFCLCFSKIHHSFSFSHSLPLSFSVCVCMRVPWTCVSVQTILQYSIELN